MTSVTSASAGISKASGSGQGDKKSEAKKEHKIEMRFKFAYTFEGIFERRNNLNHIFTEVYVTTPNPTAVYAEHEVRQIERKLKRSNSYDISVTIRDIFKPSPGQEAPLRTLLTTGIAGIGKSFSVQKFVLDWAEGKANKDLDFVFVLDFRKLNLIQKKNSLRGLLADFHSTLHRLEVCDLHGRILIVLDGLDESRLSLEFHNSDTVTSIEEVSCVEVLLTNLIQGNLLPSALVWITSRPAAASQIPPHWVDMVTEIQGFTGPQKEEYIRRQIGDDAGLADKIILHIQSSPSLNIMCHIPIFCWISAQLFKEAFRCDKTVETPQTLTEMMAHFVVVQTKRSSRNWKPGLETLLKTHREPLLKLGKLAFLHLERNNLIFYEDDLEACGIDVTERSIYSEFLNAAAIEEEFFYQKRVYCFVHLTVQEFFGALYVYDCFTGKNVEGISSWLDIKSTVLREHTLLDLLKASVDKVSESRDGHMDFFLRFLLGLTVESNRAILSGLFRNTEQTSEPARKILTYLKSIKRNSLLPERCLNLFWAMVEMRDHKLKDEVEAYLTSRDRSDMVLKPAHCSALAYILQVSAQDLDVFDLKSYNTSAPGRLRLIPAVMCSKKALLADCQLTTDWVEQLALALQFPNSALRELDLTNNDLGDLGVSLICSGLRSPYCRLEILRLSGCLITKDGCDFLASALTSNPSHLRELDLSYNHLGDAGAAVLTKLVNHPDFHLEKVNDEEGSSFLMRSGLKKYACELSLDPNTLHTNLSLSEGNRTVTWVNKERLSPPHQDRSDGPMQVRSLEALTGRCYWEAEVCGPLSVGVASRGDGGKGGSAAESRLGCNETSWGLVISEEGYHVLHDGEKVHVSSLCNRTRRVAVYLDWPAGTLSFYRVSPGSQIHLYTYRTTFTEPLYAVVEVRLQSAAVLRLGV